MGLLKALLLMCAANTSFVHAATQPNKADIAAARKPNFVFILTDDQRHTAVGYAQQEAVLTPTLDALSQQSLVFTNAHIMGAMSAAVCAPSRAMLMTGRNLFEISQTGEDIPAWQITLPQWFKQHGYHTFHTGKWHNGKSAFARSFTSAQSIFFGGMSDQYQVPLHGFDASGKYDCEPTIQGVEHSTDIYADAALNFIEHYDSSQPFFAFVAFQAPHDPKQVSQQYYSQYADTDIPDIVNLLPEHPFDNGELDVRDEWLSPTPRTQTDVKAHLKAYYAMITHIDKRIGDIIKVLERKGLMDNTYIIFTSDNGIAMGQHGLLGKQSLYDHSLRVPLLIAGPGIEQGLTIDSPLYLSNLFASISDLAGFDIPDSVTQSKVAQISASMPKLPHESKSLPLNESDNTASIYAYKSYQRAIKQGSLKLIEYQVKGKKHTQLFDLATDPLEMHNLANQAAYQHTVGKLRARLQAELSLAGDAAKLQAVDWAIPDLPQWGEFNLTPERRDGYFKMKAMAAEEHKMVLEYFAPTKLQDIEASVDHKDRQDKTTR
ncbi:sulfatase-like hydrolase/transferase [Glaciecola siphonariae]|uniref:Sulfatase-like hydrolase/transferase n=1 Tax=Glaciecola siphonariae TaxID=521012 RepID=A0ABV9LTS3_9ALTE